MDNRTIKGQTYPGQVWMAFEKDGNPHFYSKDPMSTRNRSEIEIKLGEALAAHFGHCDIINPMIIKIAAVVNRRGDRFDIGIPGRIRAGVIDRHLEDLDGSVVEILSKRSPDPSFPLNGVAMDRDGNIIGKRLYNGAGDCADGDPYHRILVVDGALGDEDGDGDADGEGYEEEKAASETDGGKGPDGI